VDSRKFVLRLDPDLADRLQMSASASGVSRNTLIGDVLSAWADAYHDPADAEEKP
jgi:predicted HicB family RNase H-like nuclease